MGECPGSGLFFTRSSRANTKPLTSGFVLQDAIDLFLGNYSVDEVDSVSPFHVQKDWKFLAVRIF